MQLGMSTMALSGNPLKSFRRAAVIKYIRHLQHGECRKLAIFLVRREFRLRFHSRRCVSRSSIYSWAKRFHIQLPV